MDSITELAKLFRERDNIPYTGPIIGKVITPPPAIRVSLDNKIILDKDNLVIAAHVLNGYIREIKNTNITLENLNANTGNTTHRLKGTIPYNDYEYSNINVSKATKSQETATMEFTDTLKAGDEVILIPYIDEQLYILVDKAVRL